VNRDEIVEFIEESFDDEEIIIFDGLEDAFLGIAVRFEPIVTENGDRGGSHRHFAVYSYEKIIEGLVADGMDETDAHEYYSFNIEGAYVGESTPAILFEVESHDVTPSGS
jgi:hypothetical protein